MPSGSLLVFVQYDVAEQIHLDRVRDLIEAEPVRREPSFKHPAPEYVRFENPPVVENRGPVLAPGFPHWVCRVKYFDYGVLSVEMKLDFDVSWEDLVTLSSRWIAAPEFEHYSTEVVRFCLDRIRPALLQPYQSWLNEDYYVIRLYNDANASAAELLASRGAEIAQIIRGDSLPLGEAERREALQACLSYYANDLLVVGWVAALVYDTPEGAAPALQLLEYANTQLLELRHYDDLLTRVLASVYKLVERRAGFHWRLAREAGRLNAIRLEVTELTERADNAIKFLSDMYYARAYKVASARVGVSDYRTLVERKLRIAGDLYESMTNEFHQARSFVLEAMVVIILVIELIHLFRGGI